MAKNSIDAYGAIGKTNLLFFDPDALTLVTDPAHPLYDSRVHLPLDENMVRNIMFQGVIQPIEVSKNPETGAIEVVTGRQRVKNASEANRRLREQGRTPINVPANARRVGVSDRASVLTAAMISENAIRQDETPISRAEKMAKQLQIGRSEDDLAVLFGCNVATVRATLSLLDCHPAVQAAVEEGAINITHARQLVKLPAEEQKARVDELKSAAAGVSGHARSRAQRAVMGDAALRMRTRKEINAEIERIHSVDLGRASALRWVLRLEGGDGDGA